MSTPLIDPIGQAILDFSQTGDDKEITVYSDICDPDIISSAYLFRSLEEMPEIEQMALEHCSGKVLDIGAGAGIHAKLLTDKGLNVEAIDISSGAVEFMNSVDIQARKLSYTEIKDEQYDTLLLMMNGIGITGKLANLKASLIRLKSLLSKQGKIICDSTDIKYLYMEEDGSLWMDLNAEYYGNFRFQMEYKDHLSPWFDWLYVDFDNLSQIASSIGLKATKLMEIDHHYLASLEQN